MSDYLFRSMEKIYPLTSEIKEALASRMKIEHFSKHDMLVEYGQINGKLYFIEKGLVRCFYYNKKRQITDRFLSEGHFLALAKSYYLKMPSDDGAEALEDCTAISLNFDILENLYDQFQQLERNSRYTSMFYNFYWHDRYRERTNMPVAERYLELLRTRPDILQRAPLAHIATYLGTTQFNLSRIRKKLAS